LLDKDFRVLGEGITGKPSEPRLNKRKWSGQGRINNDKRAGDERDDEPQLYEVRKWWHR
jgi:hypothetical protein